MCWQMIMLFLLKIKKFKYLSDAGEKSLKTEISFHPRLSYLCECKLPGLQIFFLSFSFFIVVQLQLSPLSPQYSLPPYPPHLPHSLRPAPTPVVFVHGSFIHVPWRPFPFFPLLYTTYPSSLWLLSVCSLFPCLWFYFAPLFVIISLEIIITCWTKAILGKISFMYWEPFTFLWCLPMWLDECLVSDSFWGLRKD